MKITIIYQSRTGNTAAYARAMAMYLWQKGASVSLCATSDFTPDKLLHCDCLMLGCWTSGWFVVNQHPNPIWVKFAQEHLQGNLPPCLVLFTTYKIRTGSLFHRMKKRINLHSVTSVVTLQSRHPYLSEHHKVILDQITESLKNNLSPN